MTQIQNILETMKNPCNHFLGPCLRLPAGRQGRQVCNQESVNPVRNSSGALKPAGIILKSNPAAEQRGIISNGVK